MSFERETNAFGNEPIAIARADKSMIHPHGILMLPQLSGFPLPQSTTTVMYNISLYYVADPHGRRSPASPPLPTSGRAAVGAVFKAYGHLLVPLVLPIRRPGPNLPFLPFVKLAFCGVLAELASKEVSPLCLSGVCAIHSLRPTGKLSSI